MEGTPPPKTWYVSNPGGGKAQGPFTVNDIARAIDQGNVTSTRTLCNVSRDKSKWVPAGNWPAFNASFASKKVWFLSGGAGKDAQGPFTKEDVVKAIQEKKVTSTRKVLHSGAKEKGWLKAGSWTAFNDAFKSQKVWFLNVEAGKDAQGPFTTEDVVEAIAIGNVPSTRKVLHSGAREKGWLKASSWTAFNDAYASHKTWFVANAGGDPTGPYTKDDIKEAIKAGTIKADRKLLNKKAGNEWSEARNWKTEGSPTFFR